MDIYPKMNAVHRSASSKGGVLLCAVLALGGCDYLTENKAEVVAVTDTACAFVEAAVALAPDGKVGPEVASGLALACVAAKAGVQSISATRYDDPALQAACSGPATGTAAYVEYRRQIGCTG